MTCVYTGARVYVQSHNCVVPADLHEINNVTLVAMPAPLSKCCKYGEEAMKEHTHVLYNFGGGVWLHESRYTPVIVVPSVHLRGPRR